MASLPLPAREPGEEHGPVHPFDADRRAEAHHRELLALAAADVAAMRMRKRRAGRRRPADASVLELDGRGLDRLHPSTAEEGDLHGPADAVPGHEPLEVADAGDHVAVNGED